MFSGESAKAEPRCFAPRNDETVQKYIVIASERSERGNLAGIQPQRLNRF